MKDASYWQPFCEGLLQVSTSSRYLPTDCAMDENLGCCSIPAFHGGCPQASLVCAAEILLISTQETWPLDVSTWRIQVRQWFIIAQETQVDKLEIDRRLVCHSGKISPHMPEKFLKHRLNLNLKKAAVFWRILHCTCGCGSFQSPVPPRNSQKDPASARSVASARDLPPWRPGIKAGQLPWKLGSKHVGLSERYPQVWWLINVDYSWSMLSLFDMSFWGIPPWPTHVSHARFCLHIWIVSLSGGRDRFLLSMTYPTAVRLSLSLAVASSLPILKDKMLVSKPPSCDGLKWRPVTARSCCVAQCELCKVLNWKSQFQLDVPSGWWSQLTFNDFQCWGLKPPAIDCYPNIVVSCWLTVHIPIAEYCWLLQFWFTCCLIRL